MTPGKWMLLGNVCRFVCVMLYIAAGMQFISSNDVALAAGLAAMGMAQNNMADLCYIKAYFLEVGGSSP